MGQAQPAITVVVADDEPHVIDYLRTVVHLEGFVLVGTATDADGAIREVTQLHPDVLLLDLHMPGGGLHAAQLIGALAPDTRIVVFSADADEPAVMPLLRAGIHGFVVKGAPPDRIGEAIRSAVEGAAYLAPAVSQLALGALTARLDAEEREELRRRRELGQVDEVIAQARFTIVVQPIVDLVSSAPVAVEALTRFTAVPSRTPDEWFHHADQVGRRVPLELAVSRAALTLLEDLPPGISLAVNVSPATVLSGRVGEVLIDRPLERVVLELTEHSRVDDYGRLASALRPWRDRGARLAVDDAGAGYASFTHLLHLRPELIKLDTDLVRDIHVDPSRQAMARALVGYAREMGVDVVAEGIETEAEQRAVTHLGVRYAQGYHLGRPRPLAEQVGLLEGPRRGAAIALDLRESGEGAPVGTDPEAGAQTRTEEPERR